MTDSIAWHQAMSVVQSKTTARQFSAFRSILERAQAACLIRSPSIGINDQGLLRASWSFCDVPGRVFTLDVLQDGSTDWFYRDEATGVVRGTEEPVAAMPDEVVALLAAGFGT